MIVIYTPAGGEPEHYDARDLRVSEASIVQRTVDMKWDEIQKGLEGEDLDAMRGIVWVIKKRQTPELRFGDFDPRVSEMVTRMSEREVADYVENAFSMVGTDPDLTRERVAEILSELPDSAAATPEHARALIARLAKDPKDQPDPEPGEAEENGESSSPTPTSSAPETPTSPSSDTSSTTPQTSSTA
ncbi:hypothetical protein SCAB_48161 [Streptomyces scabiei 87.22]|uniref:Uncharacterized protein n=1 Tax=Streptomyces scabiei (strain 87.22) TaxID=680198 RepID=C9ZDU3_STRSW|nr:hypothetical protein [Streptomyces scabiei]MDX2892505.1 hypothetical protein [Streptomyces scabiei]MDX2900598.1 hypothetical protein [Streptomyces scabiei]MDX2994130.1 hypothetical protein [Streptomyces scabiei]MDX3084772.1 hypothetical protein [Streptomyces scabiei]MDX3137900.1 hypothetical protein [Streptomyces scabiei]